MILYVGNNVNILQAFYSLVKKEKKMTIKVQIWPATQLKIYITGEDPYCLQHYN